MSDLICRKTMTRCQTPGMCAPHGGCSTSAEAARAALAQRCRELEHAATNDLVTRLLEQLDASKAANYHGAEFDVELGSEQMTAIVTLQRRGHPSAHDLRLRAEQERDALRAEVERLREIREIASQCAVNGGYLCSADLIELRELLKK